MSRTGMLIVLGVLTILTPFSGLPVAIRTLLTVIFGACVVGIGLSLRIHESHQKLVKGVSAPELVPPQSEVSHQSPHSISPI